MTRIRPAALILSAALLAACQSTTVDTKSRVSIPAAFSRAQAAGETQDIARWWQNWHDPVLSSLIEQGMANGYDIKTAQSRLAEAQAQARLARADLNPKAGLSAQASYRKSNADNPLSESARAALSRLPENGGLDQDRLSGSSTLLVGGFSA